MVSETIPCECSIAEEAEEGIDAALDRTIAALVQPLTAEEVSPKPKIRTQNPRIVFRGNIQEVNRFFYKRGWGDGLALIPPTEDAVAEMLTGTDLPPEHIVGTLLPRLGKATVEKIAINAVMAGALPVHMPVLLACMEALFDPAARASAFAVSTGSWAPFWIVNGPIRNQIYVNGSSGALSPGNIANAAIGRAMGLIVKNIGGMRKAIEDMGTLGNPGKYTLVLGENEENSPWEPLHVEEGFAPEDSTVSLMYPNCYAQHSPTYGTEDRDIISNLLYSLPTTTLGALCFLVPPVHARRLAQKGWTKEKIRNYIAEFAQAPAFKHPAHYDSGKALARHKTVPMDALEPIRLIADPSNIRIVVAGGPGTFIGILTGGFSSRRVIKRIRFPRNWDKLVAKYRNLTPTYELY